MNVRRSGLPKPPASVTALARLAFAKPYIGALHRKGGVVLGNQVLREALGGAMDKNYFLDQRFIDFAQKQLR